jgi:hypothetical protein
MNPLLKLVETKAVEIHKEIEAERIASDEKECQILREAFPFLVNEAGAQADASSGEPELYFEIGGILYSIQIFDIALKKPFYVHGLQNSIF